LRTSEFILREQSVASGSRPVEFPDLTRGQWMKRPPIQFG